jgi:N-acetylneuraminic acid mutarotase
MVIGGKNAEGNLSSVEVLYPGSQTWTVLQSMQESCGSAASVLYGNDVIVSGGRSIEGCSDTIERLSLVCTPLK